MLFDEVSDRIAEELQTAKFSRIAALDVWSVYNRRIFEQGLNSFGQQIGSYKSGPYKEKRKAKGLETAFVNLEFFGTMRRDYQPSRGGTVAYVFSSQREADKAGFNEERYGTIFDLTEEEAELFTERLAQLLFP